MTFFGPFWGPSLTTPCENRRPCFDNFPMFPVSHAIFIMFWTFIFFMFCSFPGVFIYYKYCTTPHTYSTQHTRYTTTHSMQYLQHTAHHITSHHITFCICLVLILVVVASVSGQAVVESAINVLFLTYSQTLNGEDPVFTFGELLAWVVALRGPFLVSRKTTLKDIKLRCSRIIQLLLVFSLVSIVGN